MADAATNQFNRLKECRYGQMLYNVNDVFIGGSFENYGEYSELEMDFFRRFVEPGDTVIDAGANIGAHTIFFARTVAPDGTVYAFEPQRLFFQTLCANVALNNFTRVCAFQAALGETPGQIMVPVLDPRKPQNFGGLELGKDKIGEPTPIMTIDSLGLEDVHLIKVDVEGMELSVLKGAEQTIRRAQPALYMENNRADRSDALVKYIDSLGYDLFWHMPPLFNPDNFFKNSENIFGALHSTNMIGVPKGALDDPNLQSRVPVPK